MAEAPSPLLLQALSRLLGPSGFTQDPDVLRPWLNDWRGRYAGAAAAMLMPSSTAEVAEIVRLCRTERVALVPQGGNTSMVGGATPDASGRSFLLSLRRMNRIRSCSPDANLAICEAGVILSDLHERAAEGGFRFPLTLGSRGSATIGGLISTNAGGTQVLRFGTMRQLVQGLEAVLPDGSIFDGLMPLKKDNRGYDLKHLLIGAEGTLGVVTAASLKLVPAAASRTVAWAGTDSPHSALSLLRVLQAGLPDAVEGFELIPHHALELVLAHVAGTRRPLAGRHRWHVLIEATATESSSGVEDRLTDLLGKALGAGLLADAAMASSEAQADAFWKIRDSISEAERKDGPAAKHDLSVSVDAMPRFMTEASEAVESRFPGTKVIAFGHLGDGNVHFNVRAPSGSPSSWPAGKGAEVTMFVHDLVVAAGGSISAEHGIGQMRLTELERIGDPVRLAAMRSIKKAFDPLEILNPGKLVTLA